MWQEWRKRRTLPLRKTQKSEWRLKGTSILLFGPLTVLTIQYNLIEWIPLSIENLVSFVTNVVALPKLIKDSIKYIFLQKNYIKYV